MSFTTIFCDLDDTLYPASTGLWEALKSRILLYMHEKLDIPWEEIPTLQEQYFRQYGTTLRGLENNWGVDADSYLDFVHDVAVEDYLHPDPNLRRMFEGLPLKKIIFTNANATHASRVITALGLDGCFEAIVDIYRIKPYCKPMRESFEIALRVAGEVDPKRCVIIDDLPRTTRAARDLGFFTVLFGREGTHPDADVTLAQLVDLPGVLNEAH